MPQWTADQRRVIESEARELICGAAAGSGKTAVLVERIVRFLKTGMEPESFLIITFTNAAASEMREKIRQRLLQEREEPLIRSALDRMDLMQISPSIPSVSSCFVVSFSFLTWIPCLLSVTLPRGRSCFMKPFWKPAIRWRRTNPIFLYR